MAKSKKSKSKHFIRPNKGKVLGGVCAAIANYFNINVTIVRVVFIGLVFLTGPLFVIAYLLGWVFIPSAK